MDSWDIDQLLFTNLLKLEVNIVKIMMKTRDLRSLELSLGKVCNLPSRTVRDNRSS